jgi:predicted nucleic acid-binding protein
MILDAVIEPVELDSDDETGMALFAEWIDRVDAGEAESIAIALARGWLVGIEDLAAQRSLDRVFGPGRWINCANVLIAAVRANLIAPDDADAAFRRLDVFSGYAKRGIGSLGQVDPSL